MRKLLIPYIIITVCFSIYTQEGVIGLKNNSVKKVEKSERVNDVESYFNNNPILPKSIYIGNLSDFKSLDINRNEILKIIDTFLIDLKNKKSSELLSPKFQFIFKNVYSDLLLNPSNDLIRWNIGWIDLLNDNADVSLELYYRNSIYIGFIYLEKNSDWLITDLQVEMQERRVFDPSSPY